MVGIKELKIFSLERNRYTSIVENFFFQEIQTDEQGNLKISSFLL